MLCKEIIVSGARNQDTRRKIAEVSQTGKGKILIGNPELETGSQYRVIIVENRAIISRECRGERRNQGGARLNYGGRNGGNDSSRQMADALKSMEAMREIIKQIVSDAVFP